jgi:hypothetical protein
MTGLGGTSLRADACIEGEIGTHSRRGWATFRNALRHVWWLCIGSWGPGLPWGFFWGLPPKASFRYRRFCAIIGSKPVFLSRPYRFGKVNVSEATDAPARWRIGAVVVKSKKAIVGRPSVDYGRSLSSRKRQPHQFSVGFSTCSMTRISTGAFWASSLRPSCWRRAPKTVGPEVSMGSPLSLAPGGMLGGRSRV